MSDREIDRTGVLAAFREDEGFALERDEADGLAPWRERFALPRMPDGRPRLYFCGNSLGLQPLATAAAVRAELEDWARLGVDAHFAARTPWYSYHEALREPGARLVGGLPSEVVLMNSLTVNLHLMLVSFYRPTAARPCILIEDCTFPSDRYAVASQIRFHGYDPQDALLVVRPRPGEHALRTEDLEALLAREGPRIALMLLGGVNYYTGQLFDISRLTACARAQGAIAGWDLAHAAGNAVLHLHDWDVDFAVWCSYKYLNAGPGAVGGCFVHERHARRDDLPRLAGWWGSDPATRFGMRHTDDFAPVAGADGWQLSNPPILAMAPLRVALEIFDEVGMQTLRAKSLALTAYLQGWIDRAGGLETLTPRAAGERGCQISVRAGDRPTQLLDALARAGVVADFREPDVVRLAPVPLYNTFHEVWQLGQALRAWAAGR